MEIKRMKARFDRFAEANAQLIQEINNVKKAQSDGFGEMIVFINEMRDQNAANNSTKLEKKTEIAEIRIES